MRIVILRGQPCRIEAYSKKIYIDIHKPKDNLFSLSDRVVSYIRRGYTGIVRLPYRDVEIKPTTPTLFSEEVKSKFPNSPNWHRYWYAIPKKEEKLQYEIFSK